jgi:biotin/methionine sulfoxide reductase
MITPRDPYIVAMEAVIPPNAEARDDYAIFRALSRHLGVEAAFTGGKSTEEWLRWIYDESREKAKATGIDLPRYDTFVAKGSHYVEPGEPSNGALSDFRDDPEKEPLQTPSGRIEITSGTITAFMQPDILPHPAWYPPTEWLGNATQTYPFHLISGQPADKLHSQMDHGPVSQSAKVNGRTCVGVNPADAARKGIVDGDLLRVFNSRGACLASAALNANLMQGVVAISTGAWLDAIPQLDGTLLCLGGNPNVLTRDRGTSELAQGPTAHSCLVNIEKYTVSPIDQQAYKPPEIEAAKQPLAC